MIMCLLSTYFIIYKIVFKEVYIFCAIQLLSVVCPFIRQSHLLKTKEWWHDIMTSWQDDRKLHRRLTIWYIFIFCCYQLEMQLTQILLLLVWPTFFCQYYINIWWQYFQTVRGAKVQIVNCKNCRKQRRVVSGLDGMLYSD